MTNKDKITKNPTKKPIIKEKDILKTIKDYLKLKKIYYTRNCFMPYTGIGVADLTLCYRGRYVAVEVKTATGRLSGVQIINQELVEESGGKFVLVRSLDDLINFLEKLNKKIGN